MIYCAILGSFERFLGILIEHYAGAMPMWLAPEQVRVLPISEKTNDYAATVRDRLAEAGLRATCDLSGEKIGAKIARGHADKLPYMLVVGPKEAEAATVNLRTRGRADNVDMRLDDFLEMGKNLIAQRRIEPV